MVDSVLNKPVSITAQSFVQWPYAMYCIRHNPGIFRTLFIQVYSGIFKDIQHCEGIFIYIKGKFRLAQAYSAPCVILAYSQPCPVPSPGI